MANDLPMEAALGCWRWRRRGAFNGEAHAIRPRAAARASAEWRVLLSTAARLAHQLREAPTARTLTENRRRCCCCFPEDPSPDTPLVLLPPQQPPPPPPPPNNIHAAAGENGWSGDADISDPSSSSTAEPPDTHALASKVSYLRARRYGLLVELRECSRAFTGARGRAPTDLETSNDALSSGLALAAKRTGIELERAQNDLKAAQKVERAALDKLEAQRQERKSQHEKQRLEEDSKAREAAVQKEADMSLLLDLMRTGEKRIAATGSVLPVTSAAAASSSAGAAGAAGGAGGEGWLIQNQLLQMMENLNSKLDTMQQQQETLQAQNEQLREEAEAGRVERENSKQSAAGGGGNKRRSSKKAVEDEYEEEEDSDSRTIKVYHEAATAVMDALSGGSPPSAAAYAARDVQMYRLPDDELQAEYERYTQLYLDERTPQAVTRNG